MEFWLAPRGSSWGLGAWMARAMAMAMVIVMDMGRGRGRGMDIGMVYISTLGSGTLGT